MTWIPDHEVYCYGCTRLVAATESGTPDVHYHFGHDWRDPGVSEFTSLCARGGVSQAVTTGMEDPRAAFHSAALVHWTSRTQSTNQATFKIRIQG